MLAFTQRGNVYVPHDFSGEHRREPFQNGRLVGHRRYAPFEGSGLREEVARPEGGKTIAFGWYGGKFSHLDWLLPLLPECHHYCEPFGGSAAVLLNRCPSPVETYNDLDNEVVNFFRVLREQKSGYY